VSVLHAIFKSLLVKYREFFIPSLLQIVEDFKAAKLLQMAEFVAILDKIH